MISMSARKEVTKKLAVGYTKLSKGEKGKIVDELSSINGWNRKYTIYMLNKISKIKYKKSGKQKKKKQIRKRKYTDDLSSIITHIWSLSGYQNSKALHSRLDSWIKDLDKFSEWTSKNMDFTPNDKQRELLETISASTLSRFLKPQIKKLRLKGKSTTKAGELLRNSITIRKATDEMEKKPGFIETDTVAHCGATLKGEFIRTITMTDVFLGWTENVAVRNNAHKHIVEGLTFLDEQFPYDLLGFDSDNGSEFINEWVMKWAGERNLYFTRSRPYKKNDNAHVEQKNNDIVRRLSFYYRYDSEEELNLLNKLYSLSSAFYNYLRPIQKAVGWKKNKAGKKKRVYDKHKTPFERLLKSKVLRKGKERELKEMFNNTNPVDIMRQIATIQGKLIDIAKNKPTIQSRYSKVFENIVGKEVKQQGL
jgi:hypothetical protein